MSEKVVKTATVFAIGDLPLMVNAEEKETLLNSGQRRYSGGLKGREPKRGIPVLEEKRFPQLQSFIGTSFSDPSWTEKSKNFWAEFNALIPYGKITSAGKIEGGREINASYTKNDEGEYEVENLEHYILFHLMQDDKEVSTNPDTYETRQSDINFYCIDSEVETAKSRELLDVKMKAQVEWAKILTEHISDPGKKDSYLRALAAGLDNEVTGLHLRKQPIEESLSSIISAIEKKPAKFMELIEDKSLITKSFINDLVAAGLVQKVGIKYVYEGEPFETIGSFAKFIKAPENANLYNDLQIKLREEAARAIVEA